MLPELRGAVYPADTGQDPGSRSGQAAPAGSSLERLLLTLSALVGSVVCAGGPGLGKALLQQEAWGTVIWGTQPSCALWSSPPAAQACFFLPGKTGLAERTGR